MEDKNKTSYDLPQSHKEHSWKDYFSLGEVGGYFFRKKDPNRPANFSLKAMHGVNKISIVMFLGGVIYLIFKHLF